MKRKPTKPPLKGGLDPVGPFHPYLVYAAVLLFDLAAVVVIVALLAGAIHLVAQLF
jgi:hypothetical protein